MQIVAVFDPSVAAAGSVTAAADGKVVCYNESNMNLIFSFANGHSEYAPAWTAVVFCGPFGSVNFSWKQLVQLTSSSAPISQVVLVAYEHGEFVPGTFPSPLVRQTNVGNALQVSNITTLINDGNAAGTQIIESTVTGDGSSAVILTNDAKLTLGDVAHAGFLTMAGNLTVKGTSSLDNGNITSNGSGVLSTKGVSGANGGGFTNMLTGVVHTAGNTAQFNPGFTPSVVFVTPDFNSNVGMPTVSAHVVSSSQVNVWSSTATATVWYIAIG